MLNTASLLLAPPDDVVAILFLVLLDFENELCVAASDRAAAQSTIASTRTMKSLTSTPTNLCRREARPFIPAMIASNFAPVVET